MEDKIRRGFVCLRVVIAPSDKGVGDSSLRHP